MQLQCGMRRLDLRHPVVMGILNTTPDSFSDGGNNYSGNSLSIDLTVRHAAQMVADGASIIDVGGESTRPGAAQVSEQQELDRVIPVVEAIARELDVLVSVDTSSPAVIRQSAAAGASIINDVRALQRDGALSAAVATGLPVCLMHMQGEPQTMQHLPAYTDVLANVNEFLLGRVNACIAAGMAKENIILDPGFGFGKTLTHNLTLVANLKAVVNLGFPVLVGMSRKSMLGNLLGREVDQRLPGSLALAIMAAERGAAIIRVHDVAATADALKVLHAVQEQQNNK